MGMDHNGDGVQSDRSQWGWGAMSMGHFSVAAQWLWINTGLGQHGQGKLGHGAM